MKRTLRNALLILTAIAVLAAISLSVRSAYLKSDQRQVPLVFSNNAMLLELWNAYKDKNLDTATHRTIDKQQNNITTSEGESYTMLRSVWMDDKTTFDQNWQWTQANLQRPDKLFAWKYGPLGNGQYGVQTDVGGGNTATDGDSDIALSLLMAYSRWGDDRYLQAANEIIPSMWNKEVVTVNNRPVLVADDLERNNETDVVVNPSYFAPYAYKLFAKVDLAHNWTGLADNSYALLNSLSANPLGSASSTGLAPDWVVLNRQTGEARKGDSANLDTNYSYDAMRVVWRLALDYQWFKDPRDKATLANYKFLQSQWDKTGQIKTSYSRTGDIIGNYESPAAYGTAIGYFTVMNPTTAKTIYQKKLQTLYSPDQQSWRTNMSYYDDNWAWFGIALTQSGLPNLTEMK